MDLLSMFTQGMTTDNSVNALSEKSGATRGQMLSLITSFLPMLFKKLTGNASSSTGIASLFGALGQHTNNKEISEQLKEADQEDGGKILEHIFGGDLSGILGSLSGSTGMSQGQVSSALSSMAPALMSGLSAATTSANNAVSQGQAAPDFNDIMGMFGGAQAQSQAQQPISFQQAQQQVQFQQPQQTQQTQSASSGGGLLSALGSLFGGGSSNDADGDGKPDTQSNGMDLLGMLMNFGK
ncbi:MAG: DUF937 domain-containing protein [Lachnospiraceae bacterium]|nr:DUF937 domain-containing protein [Lachnospiraceae bacterium]